MIISVAIGSLVVIFDKIAIKTTSPQNPIFTLLIENIFVIIGLGPLLHIRNKNFLKQMLPNKWILLILGILSAAYTMIGITAIGGAMLAWSARLDPPKFSLFLFSATFSSKIGLK